MIKDIVNRQNSKLGKAFDWFFQSLIIVSLVLHTVETLPEVAKEYKRFFDISETIIVILFTLEYALRVYASPNKKAFVFSFFGIIDLLAILPFYVFGTADFKFLRAFRLLRLLKLFRYSDAITRFGNAFKSIKNELIVFWAITFVALYVAAAGIYYFENEAQPDKFASMFHAMWWSVCTFTTVGYGDVYPITVGGKIFTCVTLMLVLGVIAIPPTLVATALMKRESDEK